MPRLLAIVVLAHFCIAPDAMDAIQHDAASAERAVVSERAAMVLSYPHDQHVFGELPPNLDSVAGAVARLSRTDDSVTGIIETTLSPGHVGKLLAIVINNPAVCEAPTPDTACGPHEEEFNVAANGGFYLGEGGVAGEDGAITLRVTVVVGDTSNVLCGGAANPDFNACSRGFALRDPHGAEVTLVVLDNGPASDDGAIRAQQLAAPSPCPTCPPFTAQIAIGFGRQPPAPSRDGGRSSNR